MLLKTQKIPEKHPLWADETPNEKYRSDFAYRTKIDKWALENQIPQRGMFHEIRVLRQAGDGYFVGGFGWWNHRLFMDRVFWVFQTPISAGEPPNIQKFYALEYYECRRVIETITLDNHLHNPFRTADDEASWDMSLIVPVEAVELAWEETSAGYSDHIRYGAVARKEAQDTPANREKEQELNEAAKEAEKNLIDINDMPEFNKHEGKDMKGILYDH